MLCQMIFRRARAGARMLREVVRAMVLEDQRGVFLSCEVAYHNASSAGISFLRVRIMSGFWNKIYKTEWKYQIWAWIICSE